jgi:hypothetical protein
MTAHPHGSGRGIGNGSPSDAIRPADVLEEEGDLEVLDVPDVCPGCGEQHPSYVELLPCPVCYTDHVHLDGPVSINVEADSFDVEVPMSCGDGHHWVAFLELIQDALFAGADQDRGHQASEPKRELTPVEQAVWAEWKSKPKGEPAPVKWIAARLDMATADVARIVYPPDRFGHWADDQEPDPEDAR